MHEMIIAICMIWQESKTDKNIYTQLGQPVWWLHSAVAYPPFSMKLMTLYDLYMTLCNLYMTCIWPVCSYLQVEAVPTVLAMKDGKIIDKFVGNKMDDELGSFVQNLIGAWTGIFSTVYYLGIFT